MAKQYNKNTNSKVRVYWNRIVVPRDIIVAGIALYIVTCILMPLSGYLTSKKYIPATVTPMLGWTLLSLLVGLVLIGWPYIFGKKVKEYKGLSDREKKLAEICSELKSENEVLRKFAGFRDKTLPKLLLGAAFALCVSFTILIIFTLADGIAITHGQYILQSIVGVLANIALFWGLWVTIYGKKGTEFCLNCDRINVNGQWKHLTSFGRFSHSLCSDCAGALMKKHEQNGVDKTNKMD